MLSPHAAALDIWETIYLHVLSGEDAVGEWAAGSSLRPFLDKLPKGCERVSRGLCGGAGPHYPRRPDGTTLLPFRRLFLLARTGRQAPRFRFRWNRCAMDRVKGRALGADAFAWGRASLVVRGPVAPV